MKCNKWTLALAAAGVVSLGSIAQAEEAMQHQVLTALNQTTLSGYVDTSAIWKFGTDRGGGRLPGHTFDNADRMDGFNLHAVKLVLEKPLDEGTWSAGYKADLVFGPDANYYSTVLNGGALEAANDFAIKQAYVALRAPVGNGIDFKMGVFDTIIGYEVFESMNNPNFSRSYGYSLEPTHHTGILASYKVNDWLGVSAGVADAAYGAINERSWRDRAGDGRDSGLESQKAYMGSITISLPDSAGPLAGSVFYAGVVNGLSGGSFTGGDGVEDHRMNNYYVGVTAKTPLEGLAVGAAFDYRTDYRSNGADAGLDNDNIAYSIAGYLSYAPQNAKWKINDRVDYFSADGGTLYPSNDVGGGAGGGGVELDNFEPHYGGAYAGYTGVAGISGGSKEHLLSNTFTFDYSLWENVITRAEFRWDHSLSGDRPFGGNENPQKNAYILAANIIYKF